MNFSEAVCPESEINFNIYNPPISPPAISPEVSHLPFSTKEPVIEYISKSPFSTGKISTDEMFLCS